MPNYRRAFIPGGCWFCTVNLLERRQTLLVDHIATLREAIAKTRQSRPCAIDAFVVLPDHLHAVWTLPPDDSDFSTRWRLIKSHFAKALPKGERLSPVRLARNERGIWQRRFWEHLIRDAADFHAHLDYIHYHPVKHHLAACPHTWPHSPFARHVQVGNYEPDWLCCCDGKAPKPLTFDHLPRGIE